MYEQGDIVNFNTYGRSILSLYGDIQMVIVRPTKRRCFLCQLVNPSDGKELESNFHFSTYNRAKHSLEVHEDFLQLVSEFRPVFDDSTFNDLLNTV